MKLTPSALAALLNVASAVEFYADGTIMRIEFCKPTATPPPPPPKRRVVVQTVTQRITKQTRTV